MELYRRHLVALTQKYTYTVANNNNNGNRVTREEKKYLNLSLNLLACGVATAQSNV